MNTNITNFDFQNIQIDKFEYSGSVEKWILTVYDKKFVISNDIRELINKLKNSDSFKEELEDLSQQELNILNKILSFDSKRESCKSGLWYKFKILSSRQLKYFKFLSIFHTKKIYIAFGGICILINFILFLLNEKTLYSYNKFHINYHLISTLILFGILGVWGIVFHELGHVSASLKYNIIPTSMGIGMYFMYPVAYVDVTDTWKLPRKARIAIDFGGIYFQFIYATILLIVGNISKNYMYLYLYLLFMFSILTNLNPFLKYDGYWLLSDFFGIYNLNNKMSKFTSCIFKYMVGRKESYVKLKNVWNKKIIFSLFFYSIITFIFYIYLIVTIITMLYHDIRSIFYQFSFLNLFFILLFSFFAFKSIKALVRMLAVSIK